MKIIAYTMQYEGPKVSSALMLRNYEDRDFACCRQIYNACFAGMRKALGLMPVECCGFYLLPVRDLIK